MFTKTHFKSAAYITAFCIFAPIAFADQDRLSVAGTQDSVRNSTDDSLLRLPGTGSLKQDNKSAQLRSGEKLVPGGGLLLSFDQNNDGMIDNEELEAGIAQAFLMADANNSGDLTPLEQIRWAESLPTYDASLANPVRFDPNLNRRVSPSEFSAVIRQLAIGLADEETGDLLVAGLRRAN